jgi:hypothetical protein
LARLLRLDQVATTGEAGAVTLAEEARRAWETSYGMVVLDDRDDRSWVAVAGESSTDIRRLRFRGRDRRARTWTTTLALEFLRRLLLGLADGWAE